MLPVIPIASLVALSASAAWAQDETEPTGAEPLDEAAANVAAPRGLSERRSRTGYTEDSPPFGGPTSPAGAVAEADDRMDPAFRFPSVDNVLEPWFDWKTRTNDESGVQISAHYSTLYQQLSDSLNGVDQASSGVLRGTLRWTPTGQDVSRAGSLNVMLDHRHAIRDATPADIPEAAGYVGLTGLFYNDIKFAVINLNWQQFMNDGDTGYIAGRYDPNDYQNILGMVNPWTIFSNLAINLDTSVALPDSSWGFGIGHWFDDNWYGLAGINDANGSGSDDLEFFDGGAEFYKFAHIGWSPSRAERYFRNFHVMAWHVDERDDAQLESAHGITFAANWTFRDRWMPFGRLGFSDGPTPIYNDSVTVGVIRKMLYRSDLIGLAVDKGSPPDSSLPDQTTIELFWRFQVAENLAITPSIQFLKDPALNPVNSSVRVWGTRFRFSL